ncbi:uroporphyrinogen-III synthase [Planctobacterium marinum]|uniref:uroporphyrinogen-III synthase n=1 Tax=Planctobacterium marinum TaxID=1631968 RepID=UPI001E2F8294|nr:uroporphyrinogen-III synthase [Planctobacterium marinum]MCC2606508.1 uroporphyrinogen-III synthase [Planctobacterium marinum]
MTETLLIVKTREGSAELNAQLASSGYGTLLAPVLKISALAVSPQLIANRFRDSDLIICLSKNAVKQLHFYQGQLHHRGAVWAVGRKTADRLSRYTGTVASPGVESSEGLWQAIKPMIAAGKRVTIVKGVGGRDYLSSHLSAAGAEVRYLNLYRRQVNAINSQEIAQAIDDCAVNTAIIGSEDLFQAAYANWPKKLTQMTLIVPSERVALAAKRQGCNNTLIANGATPKAWLEVLRDRKGA